MHPRKLRIVFASRDLPALKNGSASIQHVLAAGGIGGLYTDSLIDMQEPTDAELVCFFPSSLS